MRRPVRRPKKYRLAVVGFSAAVRWFPVERLIKGDADLKRRFRDRLDAIGSPSEDDIKGQKATRALVTGKPKKK